MVKNYYAILGVSPTATSEEIRSAYRSRAKQYHPDHSGKDSAPFLTLQEAYDVLGDPHHRNAYDRSVKDSGPSGVTHVRPEPEVIRSRRSAAEPLKRRQGSMDFGPISPMTSFQTFRPAFEEIFDALSNTLDLRSQPKGERFRTLTMEVRLTREQARWGGNLQICIPIEVACPTCGGHGDLGWIQCWRCSGSGVGVSEFPIEVEYPPGIRDLYQVAIPLDRFGIHDLCPILRFRIDTQDDFESP